MSSIYAQAAPSIYQSNRGAYPVYVQPPITPSHEYPSERIDMSRRIKRIRRRPPVGASGIWGTSYMSYKLAELRLALERGDYDRARKIQEELRGYGVDVRFGSRKAVVGGVKLSMWPRSESRARKDVPLYYRYLSKRNMNVPDQRSEIAHLSRKYIFDIESPYKTKMQGTRTDFEFRNFESESSRPTWTSGKFTWTSTPELKRYELEREAESYLGSPALSDKAIGFLFKATIEHPGLEYVSLPVASAVLSPKIASQGISSGIDYLAKGAEDYLKGKGTWGVIGLTAISFGKGLVKGGLESATGLILVTGPMYFTDFLYTMTTSEGRSKLFEYYSSEPWRLGEIPGYMIGLKLGAGLYVQNSQSSFKIVDEKVLSKGLRARGSGARLAGRYSMNYVPASNPRIGAGTLVEPKSLYIGRLLEATRISKVKAVPVKEKALPKFYATSLSPFGMKEGFRYYGMLENAPKSVKMLTSGVKKGYVFVEGIREIERTGKYIFLKSIVLEDIKIHRPGIYSLLLSSAANKFRSFTSLGSRWTSLKVFASRKAPRPLSYLVSAPDYVRIGFSKLSGKAFSGYIKGYVPVAKYYFTNELGLKTPSWLGKAISKLKGFLRPRSGTEIEAKALFKYSVAMERWSGGLASIYPPETITGGKAVVLPGINVPMGPRLGIAGVFGGFGAFAPALYSGNERNYKLPKEYSNIGSYDIHSRKVGSSNSISFRPVNRVHAGLWEFGGSRFREDIWSRGLEDVFSSSLSKARTRSVNKQRALQQLYQLSGARNFRPKLPRIAGANNPWRRRRRIPFSWRPRKRGYYEEVYPSLENPFLKI